MVIRVLKARPCERESSNEDTVCVTVRNAQTFRHTKGSPPPLEASGRIRHSYSLVRRQCQRASASLAVVRRALAGVAIETRRAAIAVRPRGVVGAALENRSQRHRYGRINATEKTTESHRTPTTHSPLMSHSLA